MTTTPAEPAGEGLSEIVVDLQTGLERRDAEWRAYVAAVQAAHEAVVAQHGVDVQRLTETIETLQRQIEDMQIPEPAEPTEPEPEAPRLLVGAAMYDNLSQSDGVEASAGVPYDCVRVFEGPTATDRGQVVTLIEKAAAEGRKVVIASFKLPYSWADMGTSKGDQWFRDTGKAMSDAAVKYGIEVHLIFHHEPENDTGTNAGNTAAGRNAWMAMQRRGSGIVRGLPGVKFGVVLMGYYSYSTTSPLGTLWKLENCIPAEAVDFVYFDLYQEYGNAKHPTAFTNPEKGIPVLGEFCNPRGIAHGLAEAGILRAGFAAGGKGATFFTDFARMLREQKASVFCYFNTQASDTRDPDPASSFFMAQGEPRWNAWRDLVRAKETLTT